MIDEEDEPLEDSNEQKALVKSKDVDGIDIDVE